MRRTRPTSSSTRSGQLSNPVVPDLPGRDSFAGPAFHSAQWRHDVDLDGKRVLVVGTGASAIQFVPGIVDRVGAMTVFQRHAPYVVSKPDVEYPARHHRLVGRYPRLLGTERRSVFRLTELLNSALEGESWATRKPVLKGLENAWRLQLRSQVKDKVLREKLRPDYPIGCKRILFSNAWYPALARDHVDVVTEAVAAVEPGGVRDADGTLHEGDVLIWGTGFSATDFLGGIEVTGRDGADLGDVWADGAYAHLGIAVPGFPNFFVVYGPNSNLGGSSIIGMLEAQSGWIAQVVQRIADGPYPALEVRRRRHRGLRPRDAGPARRQRLGPVRQLVHRRQPDHHELAGQGRGVPVTAPRGRLVGAGACLTCPDRHWRHCRQCRLRCPHGRDPALPPRPRTDPGRRRLRRPASCRGTHGPHA